MRQRLELKQRTTNRVRLTIKNRLLITGSTLAIATLVATSLFMYGNLGSNEKAMAALGSNMGFENLLTEWTTVSGVWTAEQTLANVRSGGKSIKVSVLNNTDYEIKNTSSTLIAPLTGTNKMVVMAWAKSSTNKGQMKVGVINTITGVKTYGSYASPSTSGWTQVTAVVSVANGGIYAPIIDCKGHGGTAILYVDDVHMYSTTTNAADVAAPTAPKNFTVNNVGALVSISFTDGTDASSGSDGIVVLQQANMQNGAVTLNNQATYHDWNAAVGVTTIGSWEVAYVGPSFAWNAALPITGTFTFLVFSKDKAGNFSPAARFLVVNGASLTAATSGDITLDGFFLANTCNLNINAGHTLTISSGATVNIYGTITNAGNNINNGTLNMRSGSLYKYQRDGGASYPVITANWLTGSTCQVTGATTTVPAGLGQTFNHFIWNCAQTQNFTFPSGFNAEGNVTFTATGTKYVQLNGNVNIKGNYSVAAGASVTHSESNQMYFNGTLAQQTITTNANNVSFTNVHFANSAFGVKLLGNIFATKALYLDAGTLDLNLMNVYTVANTTVYRSGGSMTNGSLAPSPSAPTSTYNLSYTDAGTTGAELTSSATHLNNLTMNGDVSDVLTLTKNATVNGTLTLTKGKIKTTSSFYVYVNNSASNAVSYVDQDGYVFGSLRWKTANGTTNYDFPVGSLNYTQNVELKLKNFAGVGYITVTFNPTLLGAAPNPLTCIANGTAINTLYNAGYWSIHPDNQPTAGNYEVRIKSKGGSNAPASASNANVIKRANSSSAWAALGTQLPANNAITNGRLDIKVKDLTSFSDFGIGYGNTTLPITLSAFDVKADANGHVMSTWITAAELNNAYFSLERSSDATNFEEIDQQQGAGTSTEMHNYFYNDERPLQGTSYYRLKQVDFDGTETYSQIRVVRFGATDVATTDMTPRIDVMAYPNPGQGLFNFSNVVTDGKKPGASVMIFDLKGQMILKQSFGQDEQIQIDLTNQPPGAYMATIVDANDQTAFQRLIIQR